MGRVEGKVAFITGAAKGQGRSHAVRLAQEGADIIISDVCRDIPGGCHYPLGTKEDLAETARMVQATGRRVVSGIADVRDFTALKAVADQGLDQFGQIDIVCGNAGIIGLAPAWEITEEAWDDVVDTILKGAWNTIRATIPAMLERGAGGSIILTSSSAASHNTPNSAHYSAAKTGVVALAKTVANDLYLKHSTIRINALCPTTVWSGMTDNDYMRKFFRPDIAEPTVEEMAERARDLNLLPVPWLQPSDVSDAVLWLASDEAKYVTGALIPVDAGSMAKAPGLN